MLIEYKPKKFSNATLELIYHAQDIIEEYEADGYDLTLRQLYYQFVTANIIPNKQSEYNRLGRIISDARLAGMISWTSIVDRTRECRSLPHWEMPNDIMATVVDLYRLDTRQDQDYYIEVWVEKEALVGVLQRVCEELDVPWFCCRGYSSNSAMWRAARRIREQYDTGKDPVILHLGDHDPSGLDMSEDIRRRMDLFEAACEVRRIALTMGQVEEFDLAPNPAKLSDSRASGYIEQFGYSSWELDAMGTPELVRLIRQEVDDLTNHVRWEARKEKQRQRRDRLRTYADRLRAEDEQEN